VPAQGQRDDDHWIYATVNVGRQRPVIVVTNDYMRDHRDKFSDMRTFMRWRSQHIAYYKFSEAPAPPVAHKGLRNRTPPVKRVELFKPGMLCIHVSYHSCIPVV
jgi:hypothetical protein